MRDVFNVTVIFKHDGISPINKLTLIKVFSESLNLIRGKPEATRKKCVLCCPVREIGCAPHPPKKKKCGFR